MAEQMMQETAGKTIPAGYQQTEVGVIPEDWGVKKGRELFTKIQDGTHFSPKISNSGFLYITSKNIKHGYLDLTSVEYIDKIQHEKIYKRCDVLKNDILLTKDGVNTGNVALNTLEQPFSLLSSVAFLRLNVREHNPVFFVQQILSGIFQSAIKDEMSGNAITRLTLGKINNLKFYVPMVQEQTAIANVLSDSDALIDALEQLIAKKQAIKSATMQQLLTGRTRLPAFALRPDGTPKGYKSSELGEIPEDWDAYKFDDIFYKVSTKKNQLTASEYMVHGIIPVVDQGKMIIVGYCDDIERMLKVDSSGVIVFGDHTCIVKYVDFNFIVGADGVQVIKGKVGFVTQFLYYAMSHLPIEPTGYNRHFSLLKESCYCIPAREEQTAITTILSNMDNELRALTQKLEKARALKQGMMQQLLTGKIRLPLAAGA